MKVFKVLHQCNSKWIEQVDKGGYTPLMYTRVMKLGQRVDYLSKFGVINCRMWIHNEENAKVGEKTAERIIGLIKYKGYMRWVRNKTMPVPWILCRSHQIMHRHCCKAK